MLGLDDARLATLPLVPYVAARALALGLGRRSPRIALALLVAAGLASAIGLKALGLSIPVTVYARLSDASLGLLCFSFGLGLASTKRGAAVGSGAKRRITETLLWLGAPALGLALSLLSRSGLGSSRAFEASSPEGLILKALAFASLLWLARPASPTRLAAAMLTLVALDPPDLTARLFTPSLVTALAALLAVALSTALSEPKGSLGGTARNLALAGAVGFGAALLALGLPWPLAGLASGLCLGYALSLRAEPSGGAFPAGGQSALTREAAMGLAFLLGLGLEARELGASLPLAAAVAAAFALLSWLKPEPLGKATGFEAAIAFAACMAARPALSDAMLLGISTAFLLGVPRRLGGLVMGRLEYPSPAIKAVVGIPPKGSSLGLMSFAAAIGDEARVLRATCVAAAEGGAGPTVADAEEALVRSIAGGAGAGIRILPSVVVSASVPDGLARAALERRADAVVVGLDAPDASAGAGSKNVIERLAAAFPGAIIAIRRPEAFAGARHLVLLAVAGSEASPALVSAIQGGARAWGRPVSAMHAIMVGAPASALSEASGGLIPESSISSVPAWRDVPQALERLMRQGVSFLALSLRPGSREWNPGHERLPVVLDSAFPTSAAALWILPQPGSSETSSQDAPGADLAGIDSARADTVGAAPRHPDGLTEDGSTRRHSSSETASSPEATPSPASRLTAHAAWPPLVTAAFASGRVFEGMQEEALVDAIRRLTDSVFPSDRRASGRLAANFSNVARKEPIELASGVLLLHAHAPGVALPTLAMGARPSGWPLVALETPVRIVVALVSPEDSGPEIHLEALTQVAKAFRSLGLADRLLLGVQGSQP